MISQRSKTLRKTKDLLVDLDSLDSNDAPAKLVTFQQGRHTDGLPRVGTTRV